MSSWPLLVGVVSEGCLEDVRKVSEMCLESDNLSERSYLVWVSEGCNERF